MCVLAIHFQAINEAPVLLAHNRDDSYERPVSPPRVHYGRPKVICPVDRKDGGTWIGVNQHGLAVAVINRGRPGAEPPDARSVFVLCRELLNCASATHAISKCCEELQTGKYSPSHFLCVDRRFGAVVHYGGEINVVPLRPGLHFLSTAPLDDPFDPRQEFARRMLTLQRLDSPVAFLAAASRVFSRKADPEGRRGLVISGPGFGTVCSTLVALTNRPSHAVFHFAPGPPSETPYDDYSAFLRQVLSAERNGRPAQSK
ncbi:MAG: NRDE family protein [Thermoguttaceae bacterium]|nr:NRDE family protein [Thermoguttaceae bacterium]MDW8079034.1 NRDE family protein [Thermoguttaceae bacterium]